MGTFDKRLGPAELNDAEAFAALALTAVAADGTIGEPESIDRKLIISRMKLFRAMTPAEMDAMYGKLVRLIRERGAHDVMNMSAEALRPYLRPTAFAVAAERVLVDGKVEGAEKEFLEKLKKALAIDDDLAMKIVEVAAIKNRG